MKNRVLQSSGLPLVFSNGTNLRHRRNRQKPPLSSYPSVSGARETRLPYRIEWTNEDPVGNIPLKEKLGEQGINLPDFDMPEEKWGIDEYFRETVKAVKKFPAWKVLIDIQIAVLRRRGKKRRPRLPRKRRA